MKFIVPVIAAALAVASEAQVVSIDNYHPIETVHLVLPSSNDGLRGSSDRGSESWTVTKKMGRITGLEVSVRGKGAYAQMKGTMVTKSRSLDKSSEYQKLREEHGIEGGVTGFWSWIGLHAKGKHEKEKLTEIFHEISKELSTNATVDVNLMATGYYPNVEVQAGAYVVALEIVDKSGNKFTALSSGAPEDDVIPAKAGDPEEKLPYTDNDSTITFD